jgi:hypothetical protein
VKSPQRERNRVAFYIFLMFGPVLSRNREHLSDTQFILHCSISDSSAGSLARPLAQGGVFSGDSKPNDRVKSNKGKRLFARRPSIRLAGVLLHCKTAYLAVDRQRVKQ